MSIECHLSIRNDLEELARVDESARSVLDACGIAAKEVFLTCLALEELLSNVIRHGYDDAGVHEISVSIRVEDGRVELEIVDDGREFDPRRAPQVDLHAPLEHRRTGGLGLVLLRKMVGGLRYERSGGRNRLRVSF